MDPALTNDNVITDYLTLSLIAFNVDMLFAAQQFAGKTTTTCNLPQQIVGQIQLLYFQLRSVTDSEIEFSLELSVSATIIYLYNLPIVQQFSPIWQSKMIERSTI